MVSNRCSIVQRSNVCRSSTVDNKDWQSMILERDLGLEISRATLDGWVLKVGELLIPMVAAMRRELITGSYIQADEIPVDVQTHEGRGQNHQAYLHTDCGAHPIQH